MDFKIVNLVLNVDDAGHFSHLSTSPDVASDENIDLANLSQCNFACLKCKYNYQIQIAFRFPYYPDEIKDKTMKIVHPGVSSFKDSAAPTLRKVLFDKAPVVGPIQRPKIVVIPPPIKIEPTSSVAANREPQKAPVVEQKPISLVRIPTKAVPRKIQLSTFVKPSVSSQLNPKFVFIKPPCVSKVEVGLENSADTQSNVIPIKKEIETAKPELDPESMDFDEDDMTIEVLDEYQDLIKDVLKIKKEPPLIESKEEPKEVENASSDESIASDIKTWWDLPTPKKKIKAKNQCDYCDEIFKCYRDRITHSRKEHKDHMNIVCWECGRLSDPRHFMEHKRQCSKSQDKLFRCAYCLETFSVYSDLKKHRATHPEFVNRRTLLICAYCGKKYPTNQQLERHTSVVHEKTAVLIECPDCPYRTYNQSYFNSHLLSRHAPPETLPFGCSDCGKRFFKKQTLEIHKKVHTDVSEYLGLFKTTLSLFYF